MSRIRKAVVSAAPASTTNITGFFNKVSGLNFANEAATALRTMSPSNNGRARTNFFGSSDVGSSCGAGFGVVSVGDMLKHLSAVHQEMLDDRSQRKRGKKRQRAD